MFDQLLGGIASGAMDILGGSLQNSMNKNAVDRANNFSAAQTQQQMDFQQHMFNRASMENRENVAAANQYNYDRMRDQMAFQDKTMSTAMEYNTAMSNTQMQRRMTDLRQAGLNPMLAYVQGGASAPQMAGMQGAGASASAPTMQGPSGASARGSIAKMENVLSGSVGSAVQTARTVQELRNMAANLQLTEAQADQVRANTRNIDVNTGLQTAQTITETGRPELVRSEVGRNRATAANQSTQSARGQAELSDYNNYGPPNTLRDHAISGGRIGTTIAPQVRQGGASVTEWFRNLFR